MLWRKITQGNEAVYWEGISWLCMTVMGKPCREMVSEKTWKGNERETIVISIVSERSLGRENCVKGLTYE